VSIKLQPKMAITSNTARADIFKEFRAVIFDNTTGVKVTNSFVDNITQMPQVVINAPQLPRNRNAFGTTPGAYNRDGEFEIELFATKMQNLVELVDIVEDAIYSNLGSISVQNISLGDSTPASIEVGGKYVHTMVIPVAFTFRR